MNERHEYSAADWLEDAGRQRPEEDEDDRRQRQREDEAARRAKTKSKRAT